MDSFSLYTFKVNKTTGFAGEYLKIFRKSLTKYTFVISADQEARPEVRRTLRNRLRYEVANNSYAKGLVQMLANDTIGTGPRLQMLSNDEDFNDQIETEFMRWADAVHLPSKLRTMRMARVKSAFFNKYLKRSYMV